MGGHSKTQKRVRRMAAAMAENAVATKEYEMEEVQKHNTEDDCWLVIGEKVYDVTAYLPEHPGGADIMLGSTGASVPGDQTEPEGKKEERKRSGRERHGDEKKLTGTIDQGYDATDDFEDVGHSTSAREEMEKFCIGKFKVRGTSASDKDINVGEANEGRWRVHVTRKHRRLTSGCRCMAGRQSGKTQAENSPAREE